MRNMTNALKQGLVIGLMGLLGVAGSAQAVLISVSNGTLSASADFTVVGGNLQVVLTNTSTSDVLVPADVLTAVFFDLNGVGALTPVSALLTAGSSVSYDPDGQPAGGVVGGEWAYGAGLVGSPGGSEGLSSSGFGLFGSANFPGANLAGPVAVDGPQYGLLSAGDNTGTGNVGGVTGSGGLILNSVTFTLSGLPAGFTTEDLDITTVAFQYGTSLFPAEPCIGSCTPTRIPEPSVPLLIGAALLAWGTARRFVSRR
ncbi:MAG TPA: XDD4 family exosortase-dependent surface protein [Casimicrobiaceae bacterium]